MKNIQKIFGLSLLCASLTLVGCGGGGGGGDGGNNDQSNQGNEVQTAPEATLPPTAEPDDDAVALHGAPVVEVVEEVVEESNPVVDVELIQPVENVAVVIGDLNQPGAIAANPEPTTLALGALGVVFLASRRYRSKA